MLSTLKHFSKRYLFGIFFIIAGLNHFLHPEFYWPLIPPYLPWPKTINVFAGILEVIGGMGLMSQTLRVPAASLVLGMLVAFIPSHIHFIHIGSCIPDGLCVSPWVAWVRLLIIHPLLLAAAFYFTRPSIQ